MKHLKRLDEFLNPFKKKDKKFDYSEDIRKLSSMYNYGDKEILLSITLNGAKFTPGDITSDIFLEYIEKYGLKNIRTNYDYDSTKFIHTLSDKVLSFDNDVQSGIIETILLLIRDGDGGDVIKYPRTLNMSLDANIHFSTFIEVLEYINNF